MNILKCTLQHFVGDLCQTALWHSSQSLINITNRIHRCPRREWVRPDHNTRNSIPYPLRIVCRCFNVPQLFTTRIVRQDRPLAYSPYATISKVWFPFKAWFAHSCCLHHDDLFYSPCFSPWGAIFQWIFVTLLLLDQEIPWNYLLK